MLYHRRSIRLPGYDYSQPGLYFVTLCANDRTNLFGIIKNGVVYPNKYGEIVQKYWMWLEKQYPYIELDTWILMPDHLHGIIYFKHPNKHRARCRSRSRTAPTTRITLTTSNENTTTNTLKRKPLGRLIGAFKTVSTKHINIIRKTPGIQMWQRNYYEHIVRDENEYYAIRRYIIKNPLNWNK